MRYEFQCSSDGCETFIVSASMATPPAEKGQKCPFCGRRETSRLYGFNHVMVKGTRDLDQLLDPKKPGLSTVSGTGISAAYQREMHGKHINAARAQADRVRKMRKNTKRADDEIRHVGTMPVEMFRAAQRTRGRHFWKETGNVKEVLNEFGVGFKE